MIRITSDPMHAINRALQYLLLSTLLGTTAIAQTTRPATDRAALAEAAAKDRAQMMQQLHLHEPTTFPAAAEDPNRPAITAQRPGRRAWTDDAGNMYTRSNWGTW